MDIKKLHEQYKDEASPSVELQIRWLRRMGFEQHQIDQAIITVYSDIETGKKHFADGSQLNLYLKTVASQIRTDELAAYVSKLEQFEAKLKEKWETERAEREAALVAAAKEPKKGWFKRLFSKSEPEKEATG